MTKSLVIMQLSELSDNNLDVFNTVIQNCKIEHHFDSPKNFCLKGNLMVQKAILCVDGGFNELETGANYRPEHRGIFTPKFPLI